MPLNVLPTNFAATNTDLVRLFHQSQLEWSRHLGEETQLDFGRWISNPALPGLHEANCLHDAFVFPGLSVTDLVKQMEEKSAAVPWQSCSLNPSKPADATAPIGDALLQAGWTLRPLQIFARKQVAASSAVTDLNLTIIPARASYRHYRQVLSHRAAEEKNGDGDSFFSLIQTEADLFHLDDSHLDSLLALGGGEPVGCVGVLTSGEVGTIREWYVVEPHRGQGIGRVLLNRAMEICTRGLLRYVMIGLPDTATAAHHLVRQSGFEPIGSWKNYVRPPQDR